MAIRKPLVSISGATSELPPGDTVEGVVLTTTLTAGSGLSGGGSLSTNQRLDLSLAPNPSGIILVGNNLGLDGVAQRTADTALSSGNAALAVAVPALASGNAALSRAGGTMTGPIIFAAGQQINTAVNISGGISGAVAYQSAPSTTAFLSPGASGQVLTTAGSNTPPVWATPAGGKILQAYSVTYNTNTSTSSTSFVNTPLSLTVTPASLSSRFLLITSFGAYTNSGGQLGLFTFFKNGTNLVTNAGLTFIAGPYYGSYSVSYNYIDSPTTTSPVTYSVAYRSASASYTTFLNYEGYYGNVGTAVLTILEIAS